MATQRDPHWQSWLSRAVEPWEACALSLRIDPDTMNSDRNDYLVGPGMSARYRDQHSAEKIDTLVEFKKRLRRLNRHLSDRQFFTLDNDGKLRLPQLVHWLRSIGTEDIPMELRMLDPTPEEQALWDNLQPLLEEIEPRLFLRFPNQLDPSGTRLTPARAESAKQKVSISDWKESAQHYAEEELRKHPKWNQERIAKEVAKRLEHDGIRGRGRCIIKWETVKRHALKGIKH